MGVYLRFITRPSRSTMALVLGVVVCSTYLTGSLVLVEGLRRGAATVTGRFQGAPYLVYPGDDLTNGRIPAEDLGPMEGPVATFRAVVLTVDFPGLAVDSVHVVAVDDPMDLSGLGPWLPRAMDAAAVGPDLWARVLAAGHDPSRPTVGGVALGARPFDEHTLLPNDWLMVPRGVMDRIPGAPAEPSFALVGNPGAAQSLGYRGYHVVPTASAPSFLLEGITRTSTILLALVTSTTGVTLVMVSSLLSVEVHRRQRDLAVLVALGASPRLLGSLVLGEGLYLTLLGTGLGLALGVIFAHGLASFGPYLGFVHLLQPALTPTAVLLVLGVLPLCGLLGALVPARWVSAHGPGGWAP